MATAHPKAIETIYPYPYGNRYRSRLEARWAVVFDKLGVKYVYEKEGYNLDGLWYLPDFWLPEINIWVEIKPELPTTRDAYEKARRLSQLDRHAVVMLCGSAPAVSTPETDDPCVLIIPFDHKPRSGCLVECTECGDIGVYWVTQDGQALGATSCSHQGVSPTSPRLLAAYAAGRQARFEHPTYGLRIR